MKISVWDTYVQREDGITMHFDILVPENVKKESQIFTFGKAYLETKSYKTGELSSNECRFCHIEKASDEIITAVKANGYAIIEMENCD